MVNKLSSSRSHLNMKFMFGHTSPAASIFFFVAWLYSTVQHSQYRLNKFLISTFSTNSFLAYFAQYCALLKAVAPYLCTELSTDTDIQLLLSDMPVLCCCCMH